jgi:hypothetical protein
MYGYIGPQNQTWRREYFHSKGYGVLVNGNTKFNILLVPSALYEPGSMTASVWPKICISHAEST